MWHQEDTALFAVSSTVIPSNRSVDRDCHVARATDFWTDEILHLDKIVYFGNLMARDQALAVISPSESFLGGLSSTITGRQSGHKEFDHKERMGDAGKGRVVCGMPHRRN
jgi:hypothetical protein